VTKSKRNLEGLNAQGTVLCMHCALPDMPGVELFKHLTPER
jgi:hypothetical protein